MPKKICTLDVTLTDGRMTEEFVAANPVVSRTIEIGYTQSPCGGGKVRREGGRRKSAAPSQFYLGDVPHGRW